MNLIKKLLFMLCIYTNIFAIFELQMPKDLDIDPEIFDFAYSGYLRIENKRPGNLIIIDYSKISTEKRFYVIDLINKKVVYKTYVSHAKNSGFEKALFFSDTPNSFQSSLGFFLCDEPYVGKYGYSLKIKGLEKNINANAEERTIVIHGTPNSEETFIKINGFLGRSLSCYALPESINREIIDYIKSGTVMFVYADDDEYFSNTKFNTNSNEEIKLDNNIPNYNPYYQEKIENQKEIETEKRD